jgi:homoserine/homoserine lactone efflux protein
MTLYFAFLALAALTVLSPGPGVVMTLSNALRFGLRGTIGGILGIACGTFVVAGISATSLAAILAASATAFSVVKLVGAAYLLYLGIRLWRAPPRRLGIEATHEARFGRRFLEGLLLQLTNPKAVFFFLSVFPPFIDPRASYVPQFIRLVLTYSTLVVAIHCAYALLARQARTWLNSELGGRIMSRAAATAFVFFGAALAAARR